jgi:3-methyladenine DNA glycosylase AlkD
MDKLISNVRQKLIEKTDSKTRETTKRYFKEGEQAITYGVKTVETRKIGKDFCRHIKGFSKQQIFELSEELWKSQYFEEAVIACMCTESIYKSFEPDDFNIFKHWVHHYVNNWAACDTFCNHTMGTFVMKYPEYIVELKHWAKSPNRWVKRASTVTLIIPARKGLFLPDILEIAHILLSDKDDLVQKGYGWMLKAASQAYEKEVFNFVMSKKAVMPRTALRYAIEKMPDELKNQAMRK